MLPKSSTDCCAVARASNTVKGPAIDGKLNPGMVGKFRPNVCRLVVWLRSPTDASRLGRNADLASAMRPCACWMDSSASATLGLPSGVSAISTARLRLSGRVFWAVPSDAAIRRIENTRILIFLPANCLDRDWRAEAGAEERHRACQHRLPVRWVANAAGHRWQNPRPQQNVRHRAGHEIHPPQPFLRRQI